MPIALLVAACRSPLPGPTYPSPPPLALSITTRFAAPAHALALRGDRLYVGIGDGLRVYDVADPAHPVPIGADVPLDHAIEAMFFDPRRPLAYAALGGRGIAVLDMTHADRPRVVSTLNTAGDTRWLAVEVVATVATVANVDSVAVGAGGAVGASVDAESTGMRTRLWLADRKGGLVGVDVTDPAAVSPLGTWPAQDEVRDVVLDGRLAYVLDRRHGLHVVDIADAMHPREIGYYDRDGDCDRLYKDGDIVWIKVGSGWWKLDVSDPALPRLMTATTAIGDTRPPPHVIAALSDEVRRGEVVFDRGGLGGSLDGDLHIAGPLQAIGSRWLVTGDVRIDVHDPRRPRIAPPIGWPTTSTARGGIGLVLIDGRWGYAAVGPMVDTFDVGHLPAATAAGNLDWGSGPSHVAREWAIDTLAVGGGRIVVAGSSFGGWPILAVGDVRDPTRPVALGLNRERLPANVVALAVSADGRSAYGVDDGRHSDTLTSDMGGLTVFDLADPLHPRVAGHVPFGGEGRAIVVHGTTAYVAADKAGVLIVDVGDPEMPRTVGRVGDASGSAQTLALDGTRLAVASSGQVAIYDVAVPHAPRLVASGTVPGGAAAVAMTPGWVWVLTGEAGLLGYDLSQAEVDLSRADMDLSRQRRTR